MTPTIPSHPKDIGLAISEGLRPLQAGIARFEWPKTGEPGADLPPIAIRDIDYQTDPANLVVETADGQRFRVAVHAIDG
ncbi:MAG TPA: hypothetical protein P5256_01315 [Beijerinckiaceae bacterium]|nr:hypothetical protein [Rhodoblastus sp.]MCB1533394.1 hypothetical protein [Rhodoblastus sp.]MCC2106115.1 hypothetical protein [Hyphomicrobiales bacterium]HPG04461.1 hypothetical protein [Rhodoblastus sp.]HRY01735.1 hypothetical protein [Beijerinckiaceae bacterium]